MMLFIPGIYSVTNYDTAVNWKIVINCINRNHFSQFYFTIFLLSFIFPGPQEDEFEESEKNPIKIARNRRDKNTEINENISSIPLLSITEIKDRLKTRGFSCVGGKVELEERYSKMLQNDLKVWYTISWVVLCYIMLCHVMSYCCLRGERGFFKCCFDCAV